MDSISTFEWDRRQEIVRQFFNDQHNRDGEREVVDSFIQELAAKADDGVVGEGSEIPYESLSPLGFERCESIQDKDSLVFVNLVDDVPDEGDGRDPCAVTEICCHRCDVRLYVSPDSMSV
ncbi:hypothetical protein [Halorubrum saccharovorum]|uniref:hypothetical protein n=1 Tax=Halorubrum saccharovorum TaxID=2248 RepID=UPI0012681A39|nr:hypothetical protein [Halorubrum saccharovorum]